MYDIERMACGPDWINARPLIGVFLCSLFPHLHRSSHCVAIDCAMFYELTVSRTREMFYTAS